MPDNEPAEPQVLAPASLSITHSEEPPEEVINKPRSEEERIVEHISIKPRSEDIAVTEKYDPEPHRQKVTLRLIALLAGLIFVHYVAMFSLDWNGKKIENVSNAFNATLPVISGLTGAAVTYYFTRRSDK
jgi:hypothetical protein